MAKTPKPDRIDAKRGQATVRKNLPRTLKAFGGGEMTKQQFNKRFPGNKNVSEAARIHKEYDYRAPKPTKKRH